MNEILEQVKNKSILRIVFGVFLIIFGLLIHLIPLVPGSWFIILGLEILGVRLLVWDKMKVWLEKHNIKYEK